MQITLYKNDNDKRKLVKNITSPLNVEVLIKESCDVLNPQIELAYFDTFSQYNYLYIPEWNRYYFINSTNVTLGQMIILNCSIDVLMSWQSQIKTLGGITSRMTGNNILVGDTQMKTLTKTNIIQHNFIGSEMLTSISSSNNSIILNVIGG